MGDKMINEFKDMRSDENLLGQITLEEGMRDQGKFNLRNPEMKEQTEYMREFHKTNFPEFEEKQEKLQRPDLRNEGLADGPFDKNYRKTKQDVTFVEHKDPNAKFDPQGHNTQARS